VIGDDFVVLGGGAALRFVVCEAAEPPPSSVNEVGAAGAAALAGALEKGAKDTTLHARVPGKPVELIGLDCVTSGMRLPLVASCIKYLCLCPSPPNGGKRERCRQPSVYGA
jgi:hypothetical protein